MATPKPSQYDKKFKTDEGLTIYVRYAKHVSYGASRPLESIEYIPIHYTGNKGDSSAGNANYFSPNGGNDRTAGAQFFVDADGIVFQSIRMSDTAYAVGGFFTKKDGAGKYYNKCKNSNSVSIELCNYTSGYPTKAQMQSVMLLIKYIQQKCPNAKTILRHWDVNGKSCLPVDSTELLTEDGWKYLDEIEVGDSVCTYNSKTDDLSFDVVQDVVEPYMAHTVENRHFEATRDHRMWVKHNGEKYTFREITYGELLDRKSGYIIKSSSYLNPDGIDLTDDELRFLVWIQGDGCYFKNNGKKIAGIEFHLKKKRKVERIKALLNDLEIPYRENWCKNGSVHIRCYDINLVEWSEKWLTNKVFNYNLINMSQEQFEIFYEELLVVDGCKSGRKELYTSAIKQNLDVVQAVAVTHGKRTCMVELGNGYDTGIQFSKCNYTIGASSGTIPSTERETMVSCVTVPTGYILIRQNKRVFIVGNCPDAMIGTSNKHWKKFTKELKNNGIKAKFA